MPSWTASAGPPFRTTASCWCRIRTPCSWAARCRRPPATPTTYDSSTPISASAASPRCASRCAPARRLRRARTAFRPSIAKSASTAAPASGIAERNWMRTRRAATSHSPPVPAASTLPRIRWHKAPPCASERSSDLLLGLFHNTQVGLDCLPALGIFHLRFVVRYGGYDDHIVTLLPVHRCRHLVLSGKLHRIQHAQDLIEIASGGHRVAQHQLDLLVRADDEDGPHGGVVGGRAAFGSIARVGRQHVVQPSHFELRVADHGISYLVALSFFDVRRPLTVATHGVDTKADDLTVPRCKAWFELGHIAQFGGANGSKVFRMREQNGPPIANPFMKVDLTLRGLSGEIRCLVVDTQ